MGVSIELYGKELDGDLILSESILMLYSLLNEYSKEVENQNLKTEVGKG